VSTSPRLLTVSNFFESHRGGLDIVAGRLARELARQGFSVTWLASDFAEPPADIAHTTMRVWNITERRLGVPWPILPPKALRRLWRAVGEADAVLLHDALYMTSVATFLAAKAQRKPLLILQHIGAVPYKNPALRGLMALANRFVGGPVLGGADQVVFISEFVRDYFAERRFQAPPQLIFNGVDTEVFRPGCGETRARTRRSFGLSGSVALFAGRFVEKKGVQILRQVAEKRPDITFAFAGWGVIDPMSWGLANVRVISDLAGPRLADLYRASDVFVLPSYGEGFPLVIQEALACGLPVVCGAESTRADPRAGELLRGVDLAGESDVVAERVAEAIDDTLASEAPQGALERAAFARESYAWSAAGTRYADLLHDLIARERRDGAVVAT
jgi:glycosyltransferase involved in cell wall biosynthesis